MGGDLIALAVEISLASVFFCCEVSCCGGGVGVPREAFGDLDNSGVCYRSGVGIFGGAEGFAGGPDTCFGFSNLLVAGVCCGVFAGIFANAVFFSSNGGAYFPAYSARAGICPIFFYSGGGIGDTEGDGASSYPFFPRVCYTFAFYFKNS